MIHSHSPRPKMPTPSRGVFGATASALALVLAACGGGTAGPSATVSGTAATGLAIGLGQVSMKCQAGLAETAITTIEGVFSVNVANATLPCLMRVEFKDSSGATVRLHSVVSAAGTANIPQSPNCSWPNCWGAARRPRLTRLRPPGSNP